MEIHLKRVQLIRRLFLSSVWLILLLTAGLKVRSVVFEEGLLATQDPIFAFLNNRLVILLVAIIEIVVVFLLLTHRSPAFKLTLVIWLSSVFLMYRSGLWLVDYHAPCSCLGLSIDWLPLDPDLLNWLLLTTLLYFLVGGVTLLKRTLALDVHRGFPCSESSPAASHPVLRSLRCISILSIIEFASAQAAVSSTTNEVLYAAEGMISVREYSRSGEEISPASPPYQFVVWRKNERWLIKTIFGPNWFSLYGCDGANVYSVLYDPNPEGDDKRDPLRPRYIPGAITKGPFPVGAAWYTTIPWFALLSDNSIGDGDTVLPALWANFRVDLSAHIYDLAQTALNSSPALPASATWTFSRKRLKHADRNELLAREGVPRSIRDMNAMAQSEFSTLLGDEPTGEYTVTVVTNVYGMQLPLEFELSRYYTQVRNRRGTNGASNPTATHQLYHGQIKRYWSEELASYVPDLLDPVSVADWRFRHDRRLLDYIRYSVTNGAWPNVDDPRLLALYQEKLSRSPRLWISSARHAVALLLVLAVFVAPAAIWFVNRRRAYRTAPNNKHQQNTT